MSDHVADMTKCAAIGCPCNGSFSSDIHSEQWFCWIHFRNKSDASTVQLKRMEWLINIINWVRGMYANGNEAQTMEWAAKEMKLHQRSDLIYSHTTDGNNAAWLRRLDSELRKAVAPQEG